MGPLTFAWCSLRFSDWWVNSPQSKGVKWALWLPSVSGLICILWPEEGRFSGPENSCVQLGLQRCQPWEAGSHDISLSSPGDLGVSVA